MVEHQDRRHLLREFNNAILDFAARNDRQMLQLDCAEAALRRVRGSQCTIHREPTVLVHRRDAVEAESSLEDELRTVAPFAGPPDPDGFDLL
jgi:hypothetical protein